MAKLLHNWRVVVATGEAKLKTRHSFRRIRMGISSIRLIPHLVLMFSADSAGFLKADLAKWADVWGCKKPQTVKELLFALITFMTFWPEFRNVFYLRIGDKANFFTWMCPPLRSLEIDADYIGPGLYIQHGISTLISAERIGANCWINQQVTVGYSNATDRPTIGDNVRIAPGAKIIGKVKVGDNATIGPNTVVLSDVPPGVTLLGVPGRVVWKMDGRDQNSRTRADEAARDADCGAIFSSRDNVERFRKSAAEAAAAYPIASTAADSLARSSGRESR